MTLLKNILKNKGFLSMIVLIASLLTVFILYQEIPKFMTFDEIEFAKLALSLDGKTYTPYSTYATGHATLYFYILMFSMKLFGVSKFGLRIPAAIFGVLNPFVFYWTLVQAIKLLEKKIHINKPILEVLPFLSALILTTSRWYVNFARFGFEATFLLFLELVSLFFMFRYMRENKNHNLIISGIFAGCAYNSYQPGRLFFLIPLLFMFTHHATISIKTIPWRRLALYILPFLIVTAPLTIYLAKYPDIRMYQLFYPDNHEMTLAGKFSFFMEDLTKTIGMFFWRGDINGRHNYTGKPALNPLMNLLLLTGFIFSITKKGKNNISSVFGIWFILSLIPTLVTYPWENPNMLRTFTVLPAVAFFSTLGIITLGVYVGAFIKKPLFKTVCLFCIIVALLGSITYELRTYFLYQRQVFYEAFEAKQPLQYYLDHPDNHATKQ